MKQLAVIAVALFAVILVSGCTSTPKEPADHLLGEVCSDTEFRLYMTNFEGRDEMLVSDMEDFCEALDGWFDNCPSESSKYLNPTGGAYAFTCNADCSGQGKQDKILVEAEWEYGTNGQMDIRTARGWTFRNQCN